MFNETCATSLKESQNKFLERLCGDQNNEKTLSFDDYISIKLADQTLLSGFGLDKQDVSTIKALNNSNCFILNLGVHFDMDSLCLVASEEYLNVAQHILSCRRYGGLKRIKPCVQVIKGDELDVVAMHENVVRAIATNVHYFVLLCSMVCRNFFLHIANYLGAGSNIYTWFTLNRKDVVSHVQYPENVVVISSHMNHVDCQGDHEDSDHDDQSKESEHTDERNLFQLFTLSNSLEPKWVKVGEGDETRFTFYHNAADPTKFLKYAVRLTLQVTMVFGSNDIIMPEALNSNPDWTNSSNHESPLYRLTCQHGLLCYVFQAPNMTIMKLRHPSCCLGYIPDLLTKLKEDLHIDIHLYEVADRRFGSQNNGTWNGMIRDVINGKADLAADFVTISEARMKFVDFTAPFMHSAIGIAAKYQNKKLPYFNFATFEQLSLDCWLVVIALTFSASLIVFAAENLIFKEESYKWGSSILYMMGMLWQKDIGGEDPCHLSSRTISVSFAIFTMVLMTSYTAVLTAKNITTVKVLPITGFDDPKVTQRDTTFRYGATSNSAHSDMFKESSVEEWRRLSQFMDQYNFESSAEGLRFLNEGKLEAIIIGHDSMMPRWRHNKYCNVKFAGQPIRSEHFGFALPKGSPWKEVISNRIMEYKENGFINQLESEWFSSSCQQRNIESKKYDLIYLSGACIMLMIGILCSLMSFIVEKVVEKFGRRFRKIYNLF